MKKSVFAHKNTVITALNVVLVLGLVCFAVHVRKAKEELRAFHVTHGKICRINHKYSGEVYAVGDAPKPEFREEKEYEYSVNGIKYIGTPMYNMSEERSAKGINIYYDASHPEVFSLSRELNVSSSSILAVAAVFAFLNTVFLIVSWRKVRSS